MALQVAVRHSHETNRRMCKQARAPRDGLMNAAKMQLNVRTRHFYKEIYVSAIPILACTPQ